MFRSSGGDDASATFSAARPHIDNPIRIGNHVEVMFDDHDGRAARHEPVEHAQQHANVERMEAEITPEILRTLVWA